MNLSLVIGITIAFACSTFAQTNPDIDLRIALELISRNLSKLADKETELLWSLDTSGPGDGVREYILQTETETYANEINLVLERFDLSKVLDEELRQYLKKLPKDDYSVLSDADSAELDRIRPKFSNIYRRVQICSFWDSNQCNLTLIPDVQEILFTSQNPEELKFYWEHWRRFTAAEDIKQDFRKFVILYRKAAYLNRFLKPSNMWTQKFGEDSEIVMTGLQNVIEDVRPLFIQLHGFLRFLLQQKYGTDLIKSTQPLPQQFAEVFIGRSFIEKYHPTIDFPFMDHKLIDMKMAGLTGGQIFQIAADFFQSMGFEALPKNFWETNVRPKISSAETYGTCLQELYYYHTKDLMQISACSQIDRTRFFNMFETVAEMYYVHAFKHNAFLYRNEPLPNFKAGIGEMFSLAASSPVYLAKIGLIPQEALSYENRINRLFLRSLRDVFVLPVYYILDKFRLNVIDNKVDLDDNCAFWEQTELYTGQTSPVDRNGSNFDLPSKLLTGVDEEFSSNIVEIVIKYQIFKFLCVQSGAYIPGNPNVPLDLCDLSGNALVALTLIPAMKLGSSKSWKEVLFTITGERELNAAGLLEYYEPLFDWAANNNKLNGIAVGWQRTNNCHKS